MASYVGSLEADLQASTEYSAGGVGPLFRQVRREAPFALPEFLGRAASALRKLGIINAVTLFVDDQEIYTAENEPSGDTLQAALDSTAAAGIDDNTGFYLMLAHQDDMFSHVISVEGSVDHPADTAALVVLDVATPLDEEDEPIEEEEGEDEENADGLDEAFLADDVDLPDISEEGMDTLDAVEAFLRRLRDELDKQLALAEPEIDVWIDWEGAYSGLGYGSALPVIPEL